MPHADKPSIRVFEEWEDFGGQKTNIREMTDEHIAKSIIYLVDDRESLDEPTIDNDSIWSIVLIAELLHRGYTESELEKLKERYTKK